MREGFTVMPDLSQEIRPSEATSPPENERAPLTLILNSNRAIMPQKSSGGLVTAMSALSKTYEGAKMISVGTSGEIVEQEEMEALEEELGLLRNDGPIDAYTFPLTKEEQHAYYEDIANNWIWPTFHNQPENIHGEFSYDNWVTYTKINQRFADTDIEYLSKHAGENNAIWIHDYHLMLVANKLREGGIKVPIGFFSHIPFPTPEVFATIPDIIEKEGQPTLNPRKEILEGLLGNDVVGFQTRKDASNFLRCVDDNFGITHEDIEIVNNGYILSWGGRKVRIGAYPISIDSQAIKDTVDSVEIRDKVKVLEEKYRGKKVIAVASRLDPSKGIIPQLDAYHELLKRLETKDPELLDELILSLIVAPSRERVPAYALLWEEIAAKVDAINAEYEARGKGLKIDLIHENLPNADVLALFELENTILALVGSEKDGMNLVAKEAASVRNKHLRIIVGKGAGAAEELKGSALTPEVVGKGAEDKLKNSTLTKDTPYEKSVKTLAGTIYAAITMPEDIAEARKMRMERQVEEHGVGEYGTSFVNDLLAHKAA